jgi:hypothetical protein
MEKPLVKAEIEVFTQLRDATSSLKTAELLKTFQGLRQLKDALKELSTAVNKEYEAWQRETIPDRFKEEGIKTISVDGFRYTTSEQVRARMQSGMKEDALDWLRNHELGDLIIETVNASTLSATARTMAEEGEELDSDYFVTEYLPATSITKVS